MPLISANAIRESLRQNSGEVFLELLVLSHPQLAQPVRLVHDLVNVVSNGETYLAFPFRVPQPEDSAESLPTLNLVVSNVDRRLVESLRTLQGPMQATLSVVTASTPDTVETGPFTFDLVSVGYNAETITGRLAFEPLLSEPFPAGSFTPQTNPGLFGRT